MKTSTFRTVLAPVVAIAVTALAADAQQIVLDQPVTAGELTVFPDLSDETSYYYVSDKPRIATGVDGRPQFSFLRYVDNVRSGADDPEAREGEGGGILHALVALSVTDDQLRDAQQELGRLRPGATIVGPVVYRSGRFALISSVAAPDGSFSERVVGVGNAPLLDGQKAAVSIHLTKDGAKTLWESFQTAAPDVSFSFEMELTGYRSPIRALVEADFDRIYEHKAFALGVATQYLAAEIKGAFEELTNNDTIKLTQIGEDDKLEALATTAYNKLAELMFQPVQGTGAPSIASLSSAAGSQSSVLDRATELLQKSRRDAREENARLRQQHLEDVERRRRQKASGTGTSSGSTESDSPEGPHITAADRELGVSEPSDLEASNAGAMSHKEAALAEHESEAEEVTVPPIAIVATFEIKKVRQRGMYRIDLNKHTADSITLRFDENIGEVASLWGDPLHFREVNVDADIYRQREIVAFVDGLNAEDFGKYINFVTVQLRKRHASGQETYDEVRIDRNNFNREGNAFKLLYGWKGDTDRRRWLEYDYRAVWSFFGGATVESGWRAESAGALNLAPPFQRRVVSLDADPSAFADAGVRAVTVNLIYDPGPGTRTVRKTLNVGKGELSEQLEFILPADRYDYEYEIQWRLKGNRSVASGRQSSDAGVLFVDEVPES